MMQAPDLAREQPRPMDAEVGGYPWLPRMIDKARASRAGTLGDYFKYPCPIDRTCLGRLGIDADTFVDVATSVEADEAIVDALHEHDVAPPEVAAFDPVALNDELHAAES